MDFVRHRGLVVRRDRERRGGQPVVAVVRLVGSTDGLEIEVPDTSARLPEGAEVSVLVEVTRAPSSKREHEAHRSKVID